MGLSWDIDNDPYFKPPQNMNDDDDNSNIMFNNNNNNNNNNVRTIFNNNNQFDSSRRRPTIKKEDIEEEDDEEAMVDLNKRTYESLDYEILLSTLQNQCYTKPGYDYIQNEINFFFASKSKSKKSNKSNNY